jgi:NDP-sugar pyrophosphorylase family protein
MKAMIFAAGRGTRLGSITETMPKALVDINGKSVLQLAVEKCHKHGFDDIIINVHHFADMVEEEVKKLRILGYKLSVSDERDELLDTGGGLYKVRDFFDSGAFLAYNVDIISDLNLSDLYDYHLEKKGLATLASRHRKGKRFYLVDDEGLLRGWRNKATGEEIIVSGGGKTLSEIAFSGIHIIEPEIFRYMEEGIYSMTKLYLKLAAHHRIHTFTDDNGFWGDIGTPESLEHTRNISKFPERSREQA